MSKERADAGVIVIFGASGDLTRRKLLPAIYNLAESGLMPDEFAILGVARPEIDRAAYRQQMREQVRDVEGEPLDAGKWQRIEDRLYYLSGELTDPALYERIRNEVDDLTHRTRTPPNVLFYFAVPPEMFGPVAHHLGESGLTREDAGWRRVVIEKPFGLDLDSAGALNEELSHSLRETQIYRIDHYLGKETVQNILAFRFANGIFEPIWNRRYIDHVQMTVAEDGGVGQRGAYYDTAGALRDIVQNHMLQLLALVAMEPPTSFGGENLRDEKVKLLRAIEPLSADDVRRHVVRGQYDGYRAEPKVRSDSRTETYVAMRIAVDNWRWAGVPFYLRTGKKLNTRLTEIAITFKRAPLMLFRDTPVHALNPNVLCLRIQPDEGISLSFDAKAPGPFERLETVTMNFSYKAFFKAEPATGYETLLFDALSGDQTLFHRMDIVDAGWRAVMPILDTWQRDTGSPLPAYAGGSWGPPEADVLMEQDGRAWRP
jgi:glucose-6-phosphate 1-dehydrogenase